MQRILSILNQWSIHLAEFFQREKKFFTIHWQDGAYRYSDGVPVDREDKQLSGRDLLCVIDHQEPAWANIQVPTGAREHLDGIVKTKLAQISPWNISDILYGHDGGETGPEGNGEQLSVSIAMVQSDQFELTKSQNNKPYRSVRYAIKSDDSDAFMLIGKDKISASPGERTGQWARVFLLTCLCAVALFWTAGIAADYWYSTQRDALQKRQTEIRRSIIALRESQSKPGSPEQELILQYNSQPSKLVLLDAIARIIPLNTFVQSLNLEGEIIQISGLSSDAAATLRFLANSGFLSDVIFSAPTVLQEDGTLQRYEITATLDRSEDGHDALTSLLSGKL